MKKKVYLMVAIVMGFTFASCQSDDGESGMLSDAKAVIFSDVPDEVVSTEETGNVIDGNKKELREIVRKQITLTPVQLVDESLSEVIYPGSILRGDAFLEGEYTPVVITNPQDITISASLRGTGVSVSSSVMPRLSSVRQATNDLLYPKIGELDMQNAASYSTYDVSEVTTKENFNKVFKIHTSGSFLKNLVSANFGYEDSKSSSRSEHYVLVKIRQQFFNISMDPKSSDSWGDFSNVGEYEPVYVSSVDYGRVVNLLIETKESADSIRRMIKGGVEAKFTAWSAKVESEYSKQWNKYFQSNKIKIMIAGGPAVNPNRIKNYEDFMEAISVPTSTTLIKSSVPISYRVRSLRNNREIEVKSFYTEERFVPKN